MTSILEVAKLAARQGGDLINAGAKDLSSLKVEQKTLFDFVSEVDRASERAISDVIRQAYPTHHILGEEYGAVRSGTGGAQSKIEWVIDPLDGTTNFLRSIPHYAVSIGVLIDGILEHAVILDPVKDEMFCASKGLGATLDGSEIKVSPMASLEGGLYATGVPFSGENFAKIDCFTSTMVDILQSHTSGIRRLGSAALDLAYVAAGRYDGYWEANLKIWDIAAGALIVKEAGGAVSDFQGHDEYLLSGNIIAAPVGVQQNLVSICAQNYTN